MSRMPSSRSTTYSVLVGILHAGGMLALALELGYSVGPTEYTFLGALWRYGGLVVVAALPTWLALRFRLLLPLAGVVVTTGYVVGLEVLPPGPTFHDVAELERLDEPTGRRVVENGLYIVTYMVNASVWTVGYLFAGLVEAVGRNGWRRLPDASGLPAWTSTPATRRRATLVATAGGLLHAVVMGWYAHRLGVTAGSAPEWAFYAYGVFGMWLLAAAPLYALVRHRLVAPATLLTAFVLRDVQAAFVARVEDPHALYFGAWFLLLAALLVAGLIEYALRRLRRRE